MIILIWIRFFAELCLYFGVALSFPKAFKTGLNPFVPVLVLSLSIALAYVLSEKGHTKLKLLTCLIPVGLMLLICRSLGDVFVMIPAAVYTLLVIIRDAQKTEYYGYLFVFKRVVAAAGGLFIALLLVEEAFKRAGALSEVVHAAPLGIYGLIYAALGVVLLKALRLGDDLKKQNMNLQLIELFVPILIVLAAALVIFGGRSAKDLLRTGLEMLFAPLVMLGDALVSTEDKGYAEKRMEAEAAANTENEGGALTGVLTTPEAAQVAEAARDNSMLVSVLLMLLLTGLMIVLVVVIGKMRKNAAHPVFAPEPLDEGTKEKKHRIKRSNAEKIRAIYKSYLKKTLAKGIKITENMTSGEVKEGAAPVADDVIASENLRNIYLSARYDEAAKPGDNDVRQAGELLKKIYT